LVTACECPPRRRSPRGDTALILVPRLRQTNAALIIRALQ
jgi:hypothetical protein